MGQAAPPKLRVVPTDDVAGAERPADAPAPPRDHAEFSDIGRSARFQPLWWLPASALLLIIIAVIVVT